MIFYSFSRQTVFVFIFISVTFVKMSTAPMMWRFCRTPVVWALMLERLGLKTFSVKVLYWAETSVQLSVALLNWSCATEVILFAWWASEVTCNFATGIMSSNVIPWRLCSSWRSHWVSRGREVGTCTVICVIISVLPVSDFYVCDLARFSYLEINRSYYLFT